MAAMLSSIRMLMSGVTSIPSPDSHCSDTTSFLGAAIDYFFFGNCGGTMFDLPSSFATLCLLIHSEGYVRGFEWVSVSGLLSGGLWAATLVTTLATQRAYSIDVMVAVVVTWLLWTYYHMTRKIRIVRDSLAERSKILAYTEGQSATLDLF